MLVLRENRETTSTLCMLFFSDLSFVIRQSIDAFMYKSVKLIVRKQ